MVTGSVTAAALVKYWLAFFSPDRTVPQEVMPPQLLSAPSTVRPPVGRGLQQVAAGSGLGEAEGGVGGDPAVEGVADESDRPASGCCGGADR